MGLKEASSLELQQQVTRPSSVHVLVCQPDRTGTFRQEAERYEMPG